LLGNPRDLERVVRIRRQALDGRHFLAGRERHRGRARPDGVALEVDGAGPTLREAAAELGPGDADRVAADPQQGYVGGDVDVVRFAVYGQGNHGRLLRNRQKKLERMYPTAPVIATGYGPAFLRASS